MISPVIAQALRELREACGDGATVELFAINRRGSLAIVQIIPTDLDRETRLVQLNAKYLTMDDASCH